MSQRSSETLLRVDDLAISYRTEGLCLPVLRELSFGIQSGEIVGLLGESGCGKTTTALAILQLLPSNAEMRGLVSFRDAGLLHASEAAMQKIRGAQISFIPQEPLLSLNPVLRVIDQVAAVAKAHTRIAREERRHRARAALEQVGLHEEDLHASYPHQLSGGQRQRVLIAQAIVCRPSLVIADEPTGSLDAASEQEILQLLRTLVEQMGMSLLLITHDPGVLTAIADRVMVMYAGRIVEYGSKEHVLQSPFHPYTRGLLRCFFDLQKPRGVPGARHVPSIEGALPDFHQLPAGCSFEPRCQDRMSQCQKAEPDLRPVESREVACFLYGQP